MAINDLFSILTKFQKTSLFVEKFVLLLKLHGRKSNPLSYVVGLKEESFPRETRLQKSAFSNKFKLFACWRKVCENVHMLGIRPLSTNILGTDETGLNFASKDHVYNFPIGDPDMKVYRALSYSYHPMTIPTCLYINGTVRQKLNRANRI